MGRKLEYRTPDDWQTIDGPAGWFQCDVPDAWSVSVRDDGLEVTSEDGKIEVSLRAFWHPDPAVSPMGVLDPHSMYPGAVNLRLLASLPISQPSVGIQGWAPSLEHRGWWANIFRPARRRKWQVWSIRHKSVCVVCSIEQTTDLMADPACESLARMVAGSLRFARHPAWPPEVFAQRVLKQARRDFPQQQCRREGGLQLRVGDSRVNLFNFYRAYLRDPGCFDEIKDSVLTTVGRLLEWGPDQLEPPLADIRSRIMPMLSSEAVRRASLPGFLHSPWVAGLAIMYVVDEDDAYWYIREEFLENWGLDLDELHQLALENLNEYFEEDQAEMTAVEGDHGPRLLMPTGADAYNSVRVLNQPFHRRLQQMLGTEFAMGIPNRDFFVAVSIKNEDMVTKVRGKVANDYRTMDHPLTDRILLISTDGVSEYCD